MTLNTIQISEYFHGKEFPDFHYIGTLPSDQHPKLQLKNIANTDPPIKLGIIFNTKPASHAGEHWVAVYIDGARRTVEYYDPYGDKPVSHNMKFLKKLEKQNEDLPKNKKFQFKINLKPHQKLFINYNKKKFINDMCGVYAVIFLLRRIKGTPFKTVTNWGPSDKQIIEFNSVINI